MDQVVSMLSAGSQMVFMDYWSFAKKHGPQLAFVEAIMKARDDFDRVVVQDIMDTLRRKVREEGITDPPEPTIMVGRAWCLDLPRLLADSRTFAEPSHRAIHQTTRTATQHQPRQHLQPRRDICWATARLRREGQGHERPAPRQAVTGRRYHCHSFVVSIYAATRHPNA
jgi:hypothetical protein